MYVYQNSEYHWPSSPGDTDYDSISVTLTFDGSHTQVCRVIVIIDDDVYEGIETFFVTLDTIDEDVTLEPDLGLVTVVDNDGESVITCATI